MTQTRKDLVPTVIVNKNGVRTTVHKKPVTPSSGKTLPSVTLSVLTDRDQLERTAAEALVSQGDGPPTTELVAKIRAKNYQKLLTVFPAYSNETLQRFIATATTELGWALNEFLANTDGDNEEFVNDWIIVEPSALDADVDSVPIIKGFTQYEHLAPQATGHYPDRRVQQTIALTRVTAHLGDSGQGITQGEDDEEATIYYLSDKKLSALITTHENPAAIADIIVERSITDPEQILLILDNMNQTASAIKDGAL